MNRTGLLAYIIESFMSYDSVKGGKGDYSAAEFIDWLKAGNSPEDLKRRNISGGNNDWLNDERTIDSNDISILIVMMYRYARGYIKKALSGSNLQTADEFSYLITLMTFDSLKKSELISKQVMEKTTGTEIIRRLVRNGLVSESSDITDKRSIRISITEKGRKEIISILPSMGRVSEIVTGNLTSAEVKTLAFYLRKLDYFHNDIYMNKRNTSLEEILQSRESDAR